MSNMSKRSLLLPIAAMTAAATLSGCVAMDPQSAARQQSFTYYNQSYESLNADQKMKLENHLAHQSNEAWRTNAQVANGFGHLMQGVGVLVFSARH
jgi:hypothetical protein